MDAFGNIYKGKCFPTRYSKINLSIKLGLTSSINLTVYIIPNQGHNYNTPNCQNSGPAQGILGARKCYQIALECNRS